MKDLLTIGHLSRDELMALLKRAARLKAGREKGAGRNSLSGLSVGLIFEKSSTRTRVSFEVAIYEMGGHSLFLSSNDLQLSRGEPVRDTARVLSRYLHAIVIRAYRHEDVEELARYASIPVINALTDMFHPCQILADLLTMQEYGIKLDKAKVAYIGDGNNVANSWIQAASVAGFELRLACPKGYEPRRNLIEEAHNRGSGKIIVLRDPLEAAQGADVLYTDVWISMGQEEETARRKKAFKGYQINAQLIQSASTKVVVMHCLPAHRGEEITEEALEHKRSVIFDQAENRLHMQKAVLERLIKV